MNDLITCENASFGYDSRAVINGLNFKVAEDDYLCVVGENGAGKSTLIKGLLQLIKPMGGKVELAVDRRSIGYMPQQSAAQKDFPASVKEIVYSGLLNRRGLRPYYSKQEKARAAEIMGKLNIAGLQNSSFQHLSGGQQQRVLLARALCSASNMLLLDEPVSGLDPMAAQEFYALLERVNREGMAIIMVSHDISSALSSAKKVLHLQHKQLYFGPVAEYTNSLPGSRFLGRAANG